MYQTGQHGLIRFQFGKMAGHNLGNRGYLGTLGPDGLHVFFSNWMGGLKDLFHSHGGYHGFHQCVSHTGNGLIHRFGFLAAAQ